MIPLAFSGCCEQGLLFVAAHSLLSVAAPVVPEHRASAVVAHGLSSAGSVVVVHGFNSSVTSSQTRDQIHVPYMASGLLSTAPPGKSLA